MRNRTLAAALALAASTAVLAQEAPKFRLGEVRFTPTIAVPAQDLQRAMSPFIGQEIGSAELQVLAAAIRRLYEDRGFGLAGIAFPTQGLVDGVLQVTIVEPRITRVSVEMPPRPAVSQHRTARVLSRLGIADGKPLDLLALDRAMYTLNDWPGVAAKATLTPSGDEGAFGVSVATEHRRAWDASIDLDNHGASASGRYRVGGLLRWNNPLGVGDNLDVRALLSNGQGTAVGRIGYEVPLGATPWRLGTGYSRVSYQLGEGFEALEALGTADVIDVSVSYPLIRTREKNLIARAALEDKRLTDRFDAFAVRIDKHIAALQLGLSFETRDSLGGGGFTGGGAGLQFGRLDIETPGSGDPATQGDFGKLSLQLTRLQALTRSVSFFVGLAGQWASRNLDNAEKLTLGGAKGVRAYPASEGSSDEGLLLNTELRYWIGPQWSAYVFHDAGVGKLRKEPQPGVSNKHSLHGYGLGVQFSDPDLFTLKASLGVRGDEPVLSETGNARTRLLVQVQRSF